MHWQLLWSLWTGQRRWQGNAATLGLRKAHQSSPGHDDALGNVLALGGRQECTPVLTTAACSLLLLVLPVMLVPVVVNCHKQLLLLPC